MSDKRCNGACECEYKTFGTWFGCRYHGYCDFQAPRDSRTQSHTVDEIKDKLYDYNTCTCHTTEPYCPIHGAVNL